MDLQKVFFSALRGPIAELLDLGAEAEISFYMDLCPVQDSFRFRAKHLGLRVATLLIDEKGEIDQARAGELKRFFEGAVFILGPNREGDALIYGHIRNCLGRLGEVWPWIRKFSPPLCHKRAEEIVKTTLWSLKGPENVRTLQTVHVRRAVMAAWLTLLRQTTGSCFATAPAILIQQAYPNRFFKDLYDLLNLGQIKRTVGGKEYSVPLSLNSGVADLHRNITSLTGIEYAPGLRGALEAAGVALTPRLQQKIREMGAPNGERLLRTLLLEVEGVTEQDINEEEQLSRIQMTALLAKQGAVYYQRPTERAQRVAEWKRKWTRACLAFQAFTECALLRSWEYTIASFCDVKTDFARWNLYIGLGLHPDHKEGIGAFLYQKVDEQLQKCNRAIEALTREYEQEMDRARAIEAMFNASGGEARRNQLKGELSLQLSAANSALEKRDLMAEKAEALSQFFSSLLRQYDEQLQTHFQELFDPALLGEEVPIYDDSPAGFRLVYKHGRTDALQWTPIYSGEQYVDSLRDFFALIEPGIAVPEPIERAVLTEITTGLIQFIQSSNFLEAALHRSREMGRRSPWDYISGGTMETLLQSYCNRDHPLTEAKVVPHSEEELLRFLAQEKEEGPLLMHSPTHAFLFYSGSLPADWERCLEQNRQFVRSQEWDEAMQEHIVHKIEQRLPEQEKALFLHLFNQKPKAETKKQFREHLIHALSPHIKHFAGAVDGVLFENSRLFSYSQAEEALEKILHALGKKAKKVEARYYSSFDLFQIAKGVLLESMQTPFSSIDWDRKIAETMRHFGYSYPYPLLFADTNWSGWFFGFIVNPVTEEVELWRMNRTAMQGLPMNDWKEWMSAANASPWILFSKPKEYTDSFKGDV